jgi:uncharacterized membrane protein
MMLLLVLTILFGIVHAMPGHGGVKAALKSRLKKAYGPIYGIASLVLLADIIWAYRQSEPGIAIAMPTWGWWANWILSLFGFICLGIFLFRGSWRNSLRFPMAIGVCLWGAGHLLANGDVKSLVFFGGLMVAALTHVLLVRSTAGFAPGPERQGHNPLSVLFGIALYGITTQLHYAVTGMELIRLQ